MRDNIQEFYFTGLIFSQLFLIFEKKQRLPVPHLSFMFSWGRKTLQYDFTISQVSHSLTLWQFSIELVASCQGLNVPMLTSFFLGGGLRAFWMGEGEGLVSKRNHSQDNTLHTGLGMETSSPVRWQSPVFDSLRLQGCSVCLTSFPSPIRTKNVYVRMFVSQSNVCCLSLSQS